MKRILFASFALLACATAFAQATPAAAHQHSGKHHKNHHHHAQATHYAHPKGDSVADRAEPLDSATFMR
ncbi:MAG TPA: hypothetical protein VG320_05265 [Paraburkholderia sp.]|jgi:hypothetical protein|uniref:hypothetical protein n=1 Tax=Paraburkholderia sp. TaxID=1926495 RepID=UPI002DEEA39A|nr:hypothetical protein [Paraburkholderia sp.]